MDIPAVASQAMKGKTMNAKNLVRYAEFVFFNKNLMILPKFLSSNK